MGIETVRYYERRGLIRQPDRRNGAYRRYDKDHVKRIRFVKRAQELGFSLDEIATLLELEDGAKRAQVRSVASARLEQIRARIADMRRIERVLKHLLAECESGKTPHCPIIETLGGGGDGRGSGTPDSRAQRPRSRGGRPARVRSWS